MNSAIANRISIFLSFVGIFVSGVLSLGKLLNVPVPCGLHGGCEDVTSHASAFWFGQPVAYYGLAAYTAFAVFFVVRAYVGPNKLLVLGPLAVAGIGAVIHVGLAIYAFTVIEKRCDWCLTSMGTMVALFFTQAVFAQTQSVFRRNAKLDLGLVVACALAATVGLGYEGMRMQGGTEVKLDPRAIGMMTPEKLAPPSVPSYGNPDAPVTVVEFGDFFCSACRRTSPVIKKIVDDSNGAIRLAFRHFPLVGQTGHELSYPAAMLSVKAAEKGKFWEFADLVSSAPKEDLPALEDLEALASSVGVSLSDLSERMNKQDPYFMGVYRDYELGNHIGIALTPTFVIMAPDESPRAVVGLDVEKVLQQPRYRRFVEKNAGR